MQNKNCRIIKTYILSATIVRGTQRRKENWWTGGGGDIHLVLRSIYIHEILAGDRTKGPHR